MTTYYVTTSGSDSNNGLNESTAFATPGYAASQATTSGDRVYIKEGTYNLTTATQNVSGGTINVAARVQFEGYKTTAGDRAARPVISTNGVTVSGAVMNFVNPSYNETASYAISIEIDGQNTASEGFNNTAIYTVLLFDCVARNCSYGFVGSFQAGVTYNCEAHNCTISGFKSSSLVYCWADSCQIGFSSTIKSMDSCIASNSTSHGVDVGNTYPFTWKKCIAVNNGGDGFLNGYDIGCVSQMISVGNGGYGYSLGYYPRGTPMMFDCADYNNTLGRLRNTDTLRDFRPINLTGDPFVDSAGNDYRINDIAGAGAELRQIQLSGLAGVNGVFDVGAIDAVVIPAGGGGSSSPTYTSTAGTQIYPFRTLAEDDFDKGRTKFHPLS
jgi:hypothetical protein